METNKEKDFLFVQIKISEDLKELYKKGTKEIKWAMDRVLWKLGVEGQERMQRSMVNTGKGLTFYRRPNGAIHWASAPGHPPAVDSGRLLNSIIFDAGSGRIELGSAESGQGGMIVNYAIWLEDGTENMAARPFVAKVAEWMETEADTRLRDAIVGVL